MMRPTDGPTSKGQIQMADDNRLVAAAKEIVRAWDTFTLVTASDIDRLRAAIEEATQGDLGTDWKTLAQRNGENVLEALRQLQEAEARIAELEAALEKVTRAYQTHTTQNVRTELQDDGRTLKVFWDAAAVPAEEAVQVGAIKKTDPPHPEYVRGYNAGKQAAEALARYGVPAPPLPVVAEAWEAAWLALEANFQAESTDIALEEVAIEAMKRYGDARVAAYRDSEGMNEATEKVKHEK